MFSSAQLWPRVIFTRNYSTFFGRRAQRLFLPNESRKHSLHWKRHAPHWRSPGRPWHPIQPIRGWKRPSAKFFFFHRRHQEVSHGTRPRLAVGRMGEQFQRSAFEEVEFHVGFIPPAPVKKEKEEEKRPYQRRNSLHLNIVCRLVISLNSWSPKRSIILQIRRAYIRVVS